ncbi:MAG: DUF115 domain-containing protein [Myxococcota bacterium]|nr:DUF115 domain-containing protein [Myxococcota bacterium]
MDLWQRNQQIAQPRWPRIWSCIASAPLPPEWRVTSHGSESTLIISGIHLTSAYNRIAEAQCQAALVPPATSTAWLYGIALGDTARVLLERTALTSLCAVVLNPSVARLSMMHVDHTAWLSDPRVDLLQPEGIETVSKAFATSPACLRLASDSALQLRDAIALELARPYQSRVFDSIEDDLKGHIAENQLSIEQDGDVGDLFDTGTAKGKTVLVIAGGPTATAQFPWIAKHRSRLVIVAVTTALIPLQQAGITPDVVVVIDPKRVILDHFMRVDLERFKTVPLVYVPVVHPDVIALWTGPRLVAYLPNARFASLAATHPKGVVFCSGTVTHAAVDLAVQMGGVQVVLVGADFCFPKGESHMKDAAQLVKTEGAGIQSWVINGYGDRVPSEMRLIGYLRDLEHYIRRHPGVTFFNTGKAGAAINGAPWLEETPNDLTA